jgi:hypothetical protein
MGWHFPADVIAQSTASSKPVTDISDHPHLASTGISQTIAL